MHRRDGELESELGSSPANSYKRENPEAEQTGGNFLYLFRCSDGHCVGREFHPALKSR